ncbi:FecR family protein [Plasticicumulans lactativorans]|uniref:FecR family protein n=1 Tax=Plasticicumulans lactativorans TaxID=1133106 RepID=A0A4R2LCU3_9GAMM|nr:FecR family protein [Plasticicumulans lactativorans]TCO80668.1 FecR family protein [Plasticicumulans lactativorans]
MNSRTPSLPSAARGLLLAAAFVATAALADDGLCRLERRDAGAGHARLVCGPDLAVETAAGAEVEVRDADGDGRADAAELSRGAVLLEFTPASPRPFEIRTPQAIAAVRGTAWAVDAAAGATDVLVLSGRVAVRAREGGADAGVELGPNEGTTVRAGEPPLAAGVWKAARVQALLRRFGR